MAEKSVEEILAEARGGEYEKPEKYAGQVLTFVDYVEKDGPNGPYGIFTVLTEAGEETQISNGGQIFRAVAGLKDAGKLPIDLKIAPFNTQYGVRYGVELA